MYKKFPSRLYDVRTLDRIEAERARAQARLNLLEQVERRAKEIAWQRAKEREESRVRLAQQMMHAWSQRSQAEVARQRQHEYVQQKVAGAERQREWDMQAAQGQYWADARKKAISSLGDELGFITDPAQRERLIVAKTYELAAQDAQANEQWNLAEELRRRARIAQGLEQPTEQDYQAGVVSRAPVAEQEMTTPERVVRGVGGVLGDVASGIYRHTAQDWSVLLNAAQLLSKKGELSDKEQRFLDLVKQHSAEVQAQHQPMMHTTIEIPGELYEAYEDLGLARTMIGEATYPGWLLLGKAGTFTGLKEMVGGLVGKDALGRAAIKITQGVLTPGALVEEGISKLIGLIPRAIKGISKPLLDKLSKKAAENPEAAEKILPVLDKIAKDQPLDAEDITKLGQFDDELGRVAKQAIPEEQVAPKAMPEGAVIGGKEAYDPLKGLFETDYEQSIRRLFPESTAETLAKAVGKLPFGEEAVRAVNPTLTPRETLAARAVQENAAVANDLVTRVANGRKAMIGNMLKALFPEGDVVKHLKIDEKGIVRGVKPKKAGASLAHVDILEHPKDYELDEPTKAFVQLWRRVHKQALEAFEKRGIKINQKYYEEGDGYFPRMVRAAYGEEVPLPRVNFRKPRSFGSQIEGIYNEIEYTRDPVHNINAFIDETFRILATHDLKQAVNAVGRTAKDAVPPSIRMARDSAVKRSKAITRALNLAQRARRGERLHPASLRAVREIDERIADALANRTVDKSLINELKEGQKPKTWLA